MKLALCIPTAKPGLVEQCLAHALATAPMVDVRVAFNGRDPNLAELGDMLDFFSWRPENVGYPQAVDDLWRSSDADVFLFLHDDVVLHEPDWDQTLLGVFERHPEIGLAGFFGAMSLGSDDIYEGPFEVRKLGRAHCFSNMRDWEVHGGRSHISMQVSMLDGFALAMRRDFLEQIDGWRWWPMPHHGYDLAVSCMARRHGRQTWLVPVDCEHRSGQTACSPEYLERLAPRLGGDAEIHRRGHELVWESFRDVLPLRIR